MLRRTMHCFRSSGTEATSDFTVRMPGNGIDAQRRAVASRQYDSAGQARPQNSRYSLSS